jgi:hypothetical protein
MPGMDTDEATPRCPVCGLILLVGVFRPWALQELQAKYGWTIGRTPFNRDVPPEKWDAAPTVPEYYCPRCRWHVDEDVVTNVLLHINNAEDAAERILEVNRFFEHLRNAATGERHRVTGLAAVDPVWQGSEFPLETSLYVGAYNYFPLDEFLEHLRSVSWEEPSLVQLFVLRGEELEFRLVRIVESAGLQPAAPSQGAGPAG